MSGSESSGVDVRTDQNVKILMVSPNIPSPRHSGSGTRLFNTLRALSDIGDVTLFCLVEHVVRDLLNDAVPYCARVVTADRQKLLNGWKYMNPPDSRIEICWGAVNSLKPFRSRGYEDSTAKAQLQAVLREQFDVIWVSRSWVAGAFPFLIGPRTILDLDDLEHRVVRRWLSRRPFYPSKIFEHLDASKLAWFERHIAKKCAKALVCSEDDRAYFGCKNAEVLPNCVDVPYTSCDPDLEIEGLLVFLGFMRYPANVDAVIYFCTEIFPRIQARVPKSRFAVVGAEPTSEVQNLHNGKDIIVTGRVPDVRPYLETASVLVVPIRVGGGTRIKILQALAAGKAIVSTTVGAEGLSVCHREHLLIADFVEEFAEGSIRLITNPAERRRLGTTGRQLVEARYSQSTFRHTVRDLVFGARHGS